jgi:myo-inositol-1(or 4)-monophosphatase
MVRRTNTLWRRKPLRNQATGGVPDAWLAAAEAAIIRPVFRGGISADLKSDDSPVTAADRGAEQAMRGVLSAAFPDHGILGEEFGLDRPEARLRWVLDPIDGTRAFITGRPLFGTLIALLDGDQPLLGLIDQPITGERWIGLAGQPSRFTGPLGGRIGCRPCASLAEAELSATSPEMFGADLPQFQRVSALARRTVWGGDCYGYGLLALGQADIVVESGLKIWDWAALLPIIEGAGGRMTDWQGGVLNAASTGQVIAVGDARLLAPVIAALGA